MDAAAAASLCRVQNCLRLVDSLNLSPAVGFKVYRQQHQAQRFLIVISVSGDAAFPVYNKVASNSDLALFRGMLLAVTLPRPLQALASADVETPTETTTTQCSIMQAFLPKFDISRTSITQSTEAEASVAASIQQQAAQHVMLVSVKHSGHLATLSDTLVSSKSSVASVHCAAAVILLHAHFARVSARRGEGGRPEEMLRRLQAALREERCSVSFEVVTRCLEHHGQVPAGEYLVATAMTRTLADGHMEETATNACHSLSRLSLAAQPTAAALAAMQQLCGAAPSHCAHITGTYPHAEWQGSRIEGFVVAQGEPALPEVLRDFRKLAEESGDVSMLLRMSHTTPTACAARVGSTMQDHDAAVSVATGNELEVAMRVAGLLDKATGINTAIGNAGGGRAEAMERQAECLRSLRDSTPDMHACFWDMLGGWRLAGEGVAGEVLGAVRGAPLPMHDHIFAHELLPPEATAPAHCRVISRSALHAVAHVGQDMMHPSAGAAGDEEIKQALRDYVNSPSVIQRSRPCRSPHSGGDVAAPEGGKEGGSDVADTRKENPENRIMHAISKPLHLDNALRYKGAVGVVVEFAQAWYDWAHMHVPELIQQLRTGSHHIASACYLTHAERFAAAFTQPPQACSADMGSGGGTAVGHACAPRMKRPMRGILVLIGFEKDAVSGVAEAVGAKVTDAGGLAWSPALPAMGTLIALTPLTGTVRVRDSKEFWQQAAADTMVVVRPLPPFQVLSSDSSASGPPPAQKRLQGCHASAQGDLLRAVQAHCQQSGVPEDQRILRLQVPQWVPDQLLAAPLTCSHASLAAQGTPSHAPAHSSTPAAPQAPINDNSAAHNSTPSAAYQAQSHQSPATGAAAAADSTDITVGTHTQGASNGVSAVFVGTKRPFLEASDVPEASGKEDSAAEAASAHNSQPNQKKSKAHKRQEKAGKQGKGPRGRTLAAELGPSLESWAGQAAARELVNRVVEWVGEGVEPAPFDRAVVVVFVTIPGAGKTFLCQQLLESLDRSVFQVVHCHGDAMAAGAAPDKPAGGVGGASNKKKGGNYWAAVAHAAATRRGDGRTTLVLADKNLVDSPSGNLQNVAAVLRATDAAVLPVLFTAAGSAVGGSGDTASAAAEAKADADAAAATAAAAAAEAVESLQSSMPGVLQAVAMHRVLRRGGHAGKLDASAPEAMHAVNAFARMFQKLPRSELVAQLQQIFGHAPCMLPVCKLAHADATNASTAWPQVLRTVAEGESYKGFPVKPTDESRAWEQRAREVLLDVGCAAAVHACQVDITEQVKLLAEHILQHVSGGPGPSDVCMDDMHAENLGCRNNREVCGGGVGVCMQGKRIGGGGARADGLPVYVAVAGFDGGALVDTFSAAIGKVDSLQSGFDRKMLERMNAEVKKDDLHVTIWHKNQGAGKGFSGGFVDPGGKMEGSKQQIGAESADGEGGDACLGVPGAGGGGSGAVCSDLHAHGLACMGLEGQEVEFRVGGFDVSRRCAAARVEIVGDTLQACMSGVAKGQHDRMHVTLWTAQGVKAREAGELRSQVDSAAGSAMHVAVDAPLLLKGTVQVFH